MDDEQQNVAMLQSDVDCYYRLLQKCSQALKEIYANRGEDEFIANICNPLIERIGDF